MKKYLFGTIIIVTSLLTALLPVYSFGQFKYRNISDKIRKKSKDRKEEVRIRQSFFKGGKNLTEFLPKHYSIKGDVDYTEYLQKGIDKFNNIIMPNFPILINPVGLVLKSNSNILFQVNSKLIMNPNSEQLYALLYVQNIKNVNIFYANLEGDRYKHLSTKGEWGMGIFIKSSENIKIIKPTIKKMWGDGIYVGNFDNMISRNIEILKGLIDECRRNGISIIGGENIKVDNCVISNTNGTAPEYGIDIEPNSSNEKLSNITISNNFTFNNIGGVLFALDKLVDLDSNRIDLRLINHIDNYSLKGVEFYLNRYSNKRGKLEGDILVENLIINNSKFPIVNNRSYNSKVILKASGFSINSKPVSPQLMKNFGTSFEKGVQSELANDPN